MRSSAGQRPVLQVGVYSNACMAAKRLSGVRYMATETAGTRAWGIASSRSTSPSATMHHIGRLWESPLEIKLVVAQVTASGTVVGRALGAEKARREGNHPRQGQRFRRGTPARSACCWTARLRKRDSEPVSPRRPQAARQAVRGSFAAAHHNLPGQGVHRLANLILSISLSLSNAHISGKQNDFCGNRSGNTERQIMSRRSR